MTRRAHTVAVLGAVLVAACTVPTGLPTVVEAQEATSSSGFAGHPAQTLTRDGGWSWFEGPRAVLDECEL
ncbi:hypothetical protein B7486_68450, partial [cyanobacterium TDX16]